MEKQTKIIFIGLLVVMLGFLGLLGYVISHPAQVVQSYGDSATPNLFSQATNGSSSCGQFATGSFTIGPSATATSTQTGNYTITLNGTVVASTSQNTSTIATTVATAIATALTAQSSTLGITASASSNVVNVTSTVWGKTLTPTSTIAQRGLTVTASAVGYPSTIVIPANDAPSYDDITDNSATGTYVCVSQINCTVGTGHYIQTANAVIWNVSNIPTAPIACIGSASSSNATVSYIAH